MLFSHAFSHIYILFILLITYEWMHDLQCCASYLAIVLTFCIFLELLLIAFHVCPQNDVQLQNVVPTQENKVLDEDLENHFPLTSVVTMIATRQL